jgi:c-di-GMP-binding flagellar brake protein YcgR
MALVKMSAHELALDTPLPFRVYSAAGNLLLNEGNFLRSESQRERLLTIGAFREADAPAHPPSHAGVGNEVLLSTATHTTLQAATPEPGQASFPNLFPDLPSGIELFQLTVCAGQEASFHVQYVGAIPDQALLVTVDDESEVLKTGTEVEARMICGRAAYAFRTRIAARLIHIPNLIQLEYPAAVKRHTIRKHLRVDAQLSARLLRNDAVAAGFDAEVTNVCANGIGFFLPDAALEVGEHFKIALRLKVDQRTHAVMLNCIARNLSRKDKGLKVGAEFGALSDDVRRIMQAYIFQQATGPMHF